MPRPKKPTPPPAAAPPAAVPPSKTSHLFGPRPTAAKNSGITRERIAADLDAFHKAGGKIEVLGVTRSLKKIDPEADDASPQPAPAKPRR